MSCQRCSGSGAVIAFDKRPLWMSESRANARLFMLKNRVLDISEFGEAAEKLLQIIDSGDPDGRFTIERCPDCLGMG